MRSSFSAHAPLETSIVFLIICRYFFEPNAPEKNKIPVVNKNLSSQQVLLKVYYIQKLQWKLFMTTSEATFEENIMYIISYDDQI